MEKKPNRLYKARLFVMIFEDKRKLLELYNAISGKHYEDPELLEINTLENAIYMSIKNDVSFLIDSRLYLYEHQSTYSPNLPLRMLLYLGDLYAGMTENENLYGRKLVKIPPPQFLIFYNGQEELPDQRTLRLSDMYAAEETEHKLELEADAEYKRRPQSRAFRDMQCFVGVCGVYCPGAKVCKGIAC